MPTGDPHELPQVPEVRGYLANMEELMSEPLHNNVGIPGQVAVELWRNGYVDTLAQFETYLRSLGSKVYCVAVPLDFFGEQYVTYYPVESDSEPEYTLYLVIGGHQEAAVLLGILGMTPEENLARLNTTGLLTTVSSEL